MSQPAAGGANPVLGAPIGSGGNPMAPGNPDTDNSADGVTRSNAEAVSGGGGVSGALGLNNNKHEQHSPTSSSSDKRTLTGGDGEGEDKDQALPLPRRAGHQDSARSSQDHIAELGEGRVSVRRGKEEFAALERRFSNMSQHSQELQRQSTRRSTRSMSISGFNRPEKTVTRQSQQPDGGEKGIKTEDDEFNLADVLRSGKEKNDQAGIKHKKVGVAWEDLEVVGGGGMKINIRNFLSAIIEQFLMPVLMVLGWFGYKPFAPKPKTILHSSSGVLKPGEMCLVLGRPGSGCSTFLKSITNQRDGYMEVKGDVKYAGVGWKEMKKLYAGYVTDDSLDLYNMQTLTITVRSSTTKKTMTISPLSLSVRPFDSLSTQRPPRRRSQVSATTSSKKRSSTCSCRCSTSNTLSTLSSVTPLSEVFPVVSESEYPLVKCSVVGLPFVHGTTLHEVSTHPPLSITLNPYDF